MTDLPELIANVYRACGKPLDNVQTFDGSGLVFGWTHESPVFVIGLDAFIRDIVPTLNERGWHWNSLGEFFDDQWVLTLQRKDMVHACSGDSPVEACFRVAWEALRPSASPSGQTHHPSA